MFLKFQKIKPFLQLPRSRWIRRQERKFKLIGSIIQAPHRLWCLTHLKDHPCCGPTRYSCTAISSPLVSSLALAAPWVSRQTPSFLCSWDPKAGLGFVHSWANCLWRHPPCSLWTSNSYLMTISHFLLPGVFLFFLSSCFFLFSFLTLLGRLFRGFVSVFVVMVGFFCLFVYWAMT